MNLSDFRIKAAIAGLTLLIPLTFPHPVKSQISSVIADLSVKTNGGTWFIDYASNGFGGWNASYEGYGGSDAIPVPADYD